MPHLDQGRIDDVICNPISTAGYCGLCSACRAREGGELPGDSDTGSGPDRSQLQTLLSAGKAGSPAFQTVVNWSARDLWMLEEDPDKRPYIWDLP